MSFSYYGLNRTVCDVLKDMRKLDAAKNYSPLLSLIEEVQLMVNRMESGLDNERDIELMHKDIRKLKKEIKKLEQKKEKLDVKAVKE